MKEYFLGYSNNNKVYRVFNIRTKVITEFVTVVVDDNIDSVTKGNENDNGTLTP